MRSRVLLIGLFVPVILAGYGEGRSPGPAPTVDTNLVPLPRLGAVEPPPTRIVAGDRAPAFSYLGPDGRWRELDDLLLQGPMLLVFGADDDALRGLERARASFLQAGVVPAAVLDMRPGSAAALGRRLGLGYPILSDPRREIARIYNSLDPWSGRHTAAYFVLDADRTVRALRHGDLPATDRLLALSARALGRALPGQTRAVAGP